MHDFYNHSYNILLLVLGMSGVRYAGCHTCHRHAYVANGLSLLNALNIIFSCFSIGVACTKSLQLGHWGSIGST